MEQTSFIIENPGRFWRRFKKGILLRGLFLGFIILGAKWTLVFLFGGEIPFGDQWDAEVARLYQPLKAGEFENASIIAPHNEHRIVATNLLNVLLFKIAGDQIDPRLQIAVSTAIHAFWFGMVGAWLARRLRPSLHLFLFAFLVILGIAPYAYENTLWSFQSQFYFNLLFWVIAFWGLCLGRFTLARWLCGLLAGICGVFSFGANGLIGVAMVVVLGIRCWTRHEIRKSEIATLFVSVGLVVLGYALRSEVDQHGVLRADSWATFSLAVIRLAAWPANMGLPVGVLLWLPGIWLMFELIGGRRKPSELSDAAVMAWVLTAANIGATALFRGQNVVFEGIAPRYLDLFAIGLIGNFLALLLLVKERAGRIVARRAFLLTWFVIVVLSIGAIGFHITSQTLPFWKESAHQQLVRIRAYLYSGDERLLEGRSMWEISHPDSKRLAKILNYPDLGEILPPSLHQGMQKRLSFEGKSRYREGDIDPDQLASTAYRIWGNWSSRNSIEKLIQDNVLWFESEGGHVLWSHMVSSNEGLVVFIFTPEGSGDPVFIESMGNSDQPLWREVRLNLPKGRILLSVMDNREVGWTGVTLPRPISFWGLLARRFLSWGPILFAGSTLGLTLLVWWPFRLRRY